jgi:hypothetical protein
MNTNLNFNEWNSKIELYKKWVSNYMIIITIAYIDKD